jgi:hypothetical protein
MNDLTEIITRSLRLLPTLGLRGMAEELWMRETPLLMTLRSSQVFWALGTEQNCSRGMARRSHSIVAPRHNHLDDDEKMRCPADGVYVSVACSTHKRGCVSRNATREASDMKLADDNARWDYRLWSWLPPSSTGTRRNRGICLTAARQCCRDRWLRTPGGTEHCKHVRHVCCMRTQAED